MEKVILIFLLIIQTSCVFVPNQNTKSQFAEDSITRIEEQIETENNVSDRQNERIEYGYVVPDIVTKEGRFYCSYKVLSKEAGAYYCVSIYNKEYRISDIMDYGDLNLKVYKKGASTMLLIGLDDLYGSVYFVYLFEKDALIRVGEINITQSDDVEKYGAKSIFFKVYRKSNIFVIEDYLDDILGKTTEFTVKVT